MKNNFEKELEKFVKSKHEGHDEVVKKFEQWSKTLEESIKKIEGGNQQFFKEIDGKLNYMNKWFAKKEKQFGQMMRFFK